MVQVNGGHLMANVMVFGRLLRRAGLEASPGQSETFLRALT
jgi:hypothetical protein